MTNPADTTHVRFAALQNLCNKELMLDKYMKGYPDNDDEKATREMSKGGARMSVNGFNYCQLVYLRDTFKVDDKVVSNYTDTLLSLCPETVKVNKEMASAQEQVNLRLSELWKAESELRRLDHARVFMFVKGVDPDEREGKRARHVK